MRDLSLLGFCIKPDLSCHWRGPAFSRIREDRQRGKTIEVRMGTIRKFLRPVSYASYVRRQFLLISLAAALVALCLAGLVSFALSGFSQFEGQIPISAALGTFVAVPVCLRLYQRAPKKASTALGWGIIAGLLSLYLMSFFFLLGAAVFSSASLNDVLAVPFAALMMTLWAFVFGGFLAPIIGGFLGDQIGKRLEQ